ncbi:MAG: ice-binding family protein, partial [Dehalococcoidia bacterium]|nr:ice-binding family protein [Dehalococcoidia bacterium]
MAPAVAGAPEAPVNLGTAGNYVILAKTGVSTVPASVITGDVGLSPAATDALTGFSLTMVGTLSATSTQVTGSLYAGDMTVPTNSNLITAVTNMQDAYTDAATRPAPPDFLDLGIGEIGGQTLTPGLYTWTTGVTISTDVTISGGPNDVWIFQIPGNLTMSSATDVLLSPGAQAKNIFWQVAGFVDIGTTAHFEGIILCQTAITLRTGASMNGRALAQTRVDLDQNTITEPPTLPPVAQVNLSLVRSSATVNLGDTFTVNVAVQPQLGQAVAGVDAFVDFNPAVLQVVSITAGGGSLFPTELGNTFDNVAGDADYSAGDLSAPYPTTSFNMATITFNTIAASANTNITFSSVFGRNTNAALIDGTSVLGSLTNTSVAVVVPAVPPVNLSLVPSAATVNVGQTFTVNVNVQPTGGLSVDAVDAFVDFDPAVLQVVSITAGVESLFPNEMGNTFDNVAGQADYSAGDLSAPFPTTSFNMATITFLAKAPVAPANITFSSVFPRDTTAARGITAVTGTLTNAAVTVTPGALHHITVSPANPSLAVGGTQTYTAATFDVLNNPRSGDPIVWSVTNATAGAIVAGTGAFTAGTVAGVYNNVIVATSGAFTGTASVTVIAGALHHITVSPANPSVVIGGNQTYTAATFDVFNNPRAGDPIAWSVSNAAVGAINAGTGVLT